MYYIIYCQINNQGTNYIPLTLCDIATTLPMMTPSSGSTTIPSPAALVLDSKENQPSSSGTSAAMIDGNNNKMMWCQSQKRTFDGGKNNDGGDGDPSKNTNNDNKYYPMAKRLRVMVPNNEFHNHHLKSRHEQLVDAMWEEARTHWICYGYDTCTIDEHAAKQLLRGIQLESIATKPLPIPSHHSRVSAAEKLELTFRLPTQYGTASNNLYRWFVSWYDIQGPDVAVAGSLRCQPFVEDPPFENVIMHHLNSTTSSNNSHQQFWEQVDEEHYQQAHQIRKGGWNLHPLDNWKTECAQWLVGAGLASDSNAVGSNSSIPLETVARLVTAGVGVLARDALTTNKHNNYQHQNNHEAFMIHTATNSDASSSSSPQEKETSLPQNHHANWVLRKLMLRLERELKSWNNLHAKDPKEMEVLESIQRRGGLMSHPRVVEAIKRENRWNQPVLPSY